MSELIAYRATNELCWVAEVGNTPVRLCIASWRVPQPLPRRVRIQLDEQTAPPATAPGAETEVVQLLPEGIKDEQKSRPISVLLKRKSRLDGVVRYDPDRPTTSWPIGSMFLPDSMFESNNGNGKVLTARIDWLG
jgi:hypothetical protein